MTNVALSQLRLVNQDKSTPKVQKETIFSPAPESLRTQLQLVVVTVTEKITALWMSSLNHSKTWINSTKLPTICIIYKILLLPWEHPRFPTWGFWPLARISLLRAMTMWERSLGWPSTGSRFQTSTTVKLIPTSWDPRVPSRSMTMLNLKVRTMFRTWRILMHRPMSVSRLNARIWRTPGNSKESNTDGRSTRKTWLLSTKMSSKEGTTSRISHTWHSRSKMTARESSYRKRWRDSTSNLILDPRKRMIWWWRSKTASKDRKFSSSSSCLTRWRPKLSSKLRNTRQSALMTCTTLRQLKTLIKLRRKPNLKNMFQTSKLLFLFIF